MSDVNVNEEKRIADALERIAKALEMLATKPQWVKVAEEVVSEVKKVEEKAPVVEKPVPEPVKEEKVMETVEKATEVIQEGDLVGQTVVIIEGDHKGKVGVCTNKMRAWAYVEVDGEQLAVRPSHIRLSDDDVNAAIEHVVEVIEDTPVEEASVIEVEVIGAAPSEEADDAANFVIAGGKHAGKTIHSLYGESSLGEKTVAWMAKNHNDDAHKEAAQAYLKSKGVSA
jgi:hypothetical protein